MRNIENGKHQDQNIVYVTQYFHEFQVSSIFFTNDVTITNFYNIFDIQMPNLSEMTWTVQLSKKYDKLCGCDMCTANTDSYLQRKLPATTS